MIFCFLRWRPPVLCWSLLHVGGIMIKMVCRCQKIFRSLLPLIFFFLKVAFDESIGGTNRQLRKFCLLFLLFRVNFCRYNLVLFCMYIKLCPLFFIILVIIGFSFMVDVALLCFPICYQALYNYRSRRFLLSVEVHRQWLMK